MRPPAAPGAGPVAPAPLPPLLHAALDPARPAEATDALLSSHLGEPLEAVRAWSVGRRLDALLGLRLRDGQAREPIPLRCTSCRCAFEVEVELRDCRRPVVDGPVGFTVGPAGWQARQPTGEDQARWQREGCPAEEAGAQLLLRQRADTDGVADAAGADEARATGPAGAPDTGAALLDAALLDALGRALAERDPLRALPLQADCPGCGHAATHEVDLELRLVHAFARDQRRLLADIATLARAFGWHEADVAALPAWRRAFYLQQVEAPSAP